ncbi:MAG: methyltransferase regulatory domain-containing protein [Dehalococcoidia bacterium]
MAASRHTSYDDVAYPSLSHRQTHPDTMATVARLIGFAAAAADRCRYLDIGCAVGGNLLPLAETLPDAEFVGIDYAPRQIDEARRRAAAMGITNVRFECLDIRDGGRDLGTFDYIVAHGIYSWVPPDVRDRLLAMCQELLRPHGIAYVSYNTLPGWHLLGMIRGALRWGSRHASTPGERIAQATAYLEFVRGLVTSESSVVRSVLSLYDEKTQGRDDLPQEVMDALVLHDELEEVNDPVYFHEFAAHAARHGLQYVCEADFARTMHAELPPEVLQQVTTAARDIIELEQHIDFVRNGTFRMSLLCHAGIPIGRSIAVGADTLRGMYAATQARPAKRPYGKVPPGRLSFRAGNNAALTTDHPVSKAALLRLVERSPFPMAFEELADRAIADIYGARPGDESIARDVALLAENLVRGFGYSNQLIELSTVRPGFADGVSMRPVASSFARLIAIEGGHLVTNRRHQRVLLTEHQRQLLAMLDGATSVDELRSRSPFAASPEGAGSGDSRPGDWVDEQLQWFAESALLVS